MSKIYTEAGCAVEVQRVWEEESAVHENGVHVVKVTHTDAKGRSQLFVCEASAAASIGLLLLAASRPPEDPSVQDPELPDVNP